MVIGVLNPWAPKPTLDKLHTMSYVPADTEFDAVTVKLVELLLVLVTVDGENVIPAEDDKAMVSVPELTAVLKVSE